jgi:hypothetical protein
MTQDEIVEMYLEVSNKLCNGTEWCWAGVGEPLQLFAKLVAEKEREACAKVCDDHWEKGGAAYYCAKTIRYRGQA